MPLGITNDNQALRCDIDGDGQPDILVDAKSGTFTGVVHGEGRPDVSLTSYGQGPVRTAVFYNTGQTDRPFAKSPTQTLDLDALAGDKQINGPLLRDSIPAADFNGDGHLDVGSLGNTKTGVGAGGPLAVYACLQQKEN